jgi:hypothetical protein
MISKQNMSDIRKDLDFSIVKRFHQIKILEFLKTNLPLFARKLIEVDNDLSSTYEDNITREIVNLLNDRLRENGDYIFRFEPQIGPDMLIFASPYIPFSKVLLVIEAKRLPPSSNQDYVKTGIGRFKKEEHGKKHDIAAMLGYVQENNFSHWYDEVNSWIMSLISDTSENPRWTKEEQINKIQTTDIGEYQSTHCRITEEPITLHHFWINLCDPASKIILN